MLYIPAFVVAFLLSPGAASERIIFESANCAEWGCYEATTEKTCGMWASNLGRNGSYVRASVSPAPRGCYFYSKDDRVYFNGGGEQFKECSSSQRCVCDCPTAIDVAFYHDIGASSRGKANIFEVLQYKTEMETIRVHNFSAADFHTRLELGVHDVVFFPGGGGSKEERGLSLKGKTAIKTFLAGGGGFVGICAGAYLAITSSFRISPFKNIAKPKPNPPGRGDGNVTLRVAPDGAKTLANFGVTNGELDRTDALVFYAGGPVMRLPEKPLPENITNPRVLVIFTSSVPIELNLTGSISGIGDGAVVASTWGGGGTVVCSGPHPETDQLNFPERHGPPSAEGSIYARLLQSYVRYAAIS